MSLLLLFAGGPIGPIQGDLTITEANDGVAASSSLSVSGSAGSMEMDDVATSASALVITAQVFVVEVDDTGVANAILLLTGSVPFTEGNDMPSAEGMAAIVGSADFIEDNDIVVAGGAVGVASVFAMVEGDDEFAASALMPIWHVRRGGADELALYEHQQREWQEQLRQIIDRSWRIAHGEIDPQTLLPILPPDYSVVIAEMINQALAIESGTHRGLHCRTGATAGRAGNLHPSPRRIANQLGDLGLIGIVHGERHSPSYHKAAP